MPDWSYRTVLRPALFALPPRAARDLSLGVMGALGRSWPGRLLIDFLGHMRAPDGLRRRASASRSPPAWASARPRPAPARDRGAGPLRRRLRRGRPDRADAAPRAASSTATSAARASSSPIRRSSAGRRRSPGSPRVRAPARRSSSGSTLARDPDAAPTPSPAAPGAARLRLHRRRARRVVDGRRVAGVIAARVAAAGGAAAVPVVPRLRRRSTAVARRAARCDGFVVDGAAPADAGRHVIGRAGRDAARDRPPAPRRPRPGRRRSSPAAASTSRRTRSTSSTPAPIWSRSTAASCSPARACPSGSTSAVPCRRGRHRAGSRRSPPPGVPGDELVLDAAHGARDARRQRAGPRDRGDARGAALRRAVRRADARTSWRPSTSGCWRSWPTTA